MRKHAATSGAALIACLTGLIISSLTLAPQAKATISSDPAIFWNELTTGFAQGAKLNPVRLARAYALVHVAIYDALLAASLRQSGEPSEAAVAAGAASTVLTYLFPGNASLIVQAEAAEAGSAQGANPGLIASGLRFGASVGKMVVRHGEMDGSDAVFTGSFPTGPCVWTGVHPVEPLAGTWRTWILTSGSEVQPDPPYACGSPADLADIQAVISAHQNLTPEEVTIVHKWADRLPPTIWNGLLNEQIESQGMTVLGSARAHAYLNVAMYDAFVSCWFTKYAHWMARPFQRIPDFESVIQTPNFPSYDSGHSTVSGAASLVMGELFPGLRDYFAGQAEEAAISRLWAGIHFPHDNEQGLIVGRTIGALVVLDMEGPPHTFVFPMTIPPEAD